MRQRQYSAVPRPGPLARLCECGCHTSLDDLDASHVRVRVDDGRAADSRCLDVDDGARARAAASIYVFARCWLPDAGGGAETVGAWVGTGCVREIWEWYGSKRVWGGVGRCGGDELE